MTAPSRQEIVDAFEKAEKLRCSSEISCPHCTGKFSLQQEAIDKILDGLNQTVGLTCFSEILEDLKNVVDEVEALNPLPNALTFFTDGYPVVRDHFKENENIRKAIAAVSPKVASTLLVGYGDDFSHTVP